MDTSSGLSSIASLSLGFTMSMRPIPPPKSATGAVPHGFPPSSSSSSASCRSHSTRSSSALLMRQQTIEETPKHLRRTGTWCLAQRHKNQEEPRPRGSPATQSFHMRRIAEEHAGATKGPSRCMGVSGTMGVGGTRGATEAVGLNGITTDGVSSLNKGLSDVATAAAAADDDDDNGDVDDKKAGHCSVKNPAVFSVVPMDEAKDSNLEIKHPGPTENNSDQDLEQSSTIPDTVLRPELASGPRDLCSDPEPEVFHSAGVAADTSAPIYEDLGNCYSSSNQTNTHQHPPEQPAPCHRSIDGAVRWFRWRSAGNSRCSSSSSTSSVCAQTVDKAVTAHVSFTPPPPPHFVRQTSHASSSTASNKRSAWRNTSTKHCFL